MSIYSVLFCVPVLMALIWTGLYFDLVVKMKGAHNIVFGGLWSLTVLIYTMLMWPEARTKAIEHSAKQAPTMTRSTPIYKALKQANWIALIVVLTWHGYFVLAIILALLPGAAKQFTIDVDARRKVLQEEAKEKEGEDGEDV